MSDLCYMCLQNQHKPTTGPLGGAFAEYITIPTSVLSKKPAVLPISRQRPLLWLVAPHMDVSSIASRFSQAPKFLFWEGPLR